MQHMLLFCMCLHMNAGFSIKIAKKYFKQKKQILSTVQLLFILISAFLPFFGLWKQKVEKMSQSKLRWYMNWHWTNV